MVDISSFHPSRVSYIGSHSEKLGSLGLKVSALETKEEYTNKLLYDIHGKMCVFEEKFNECIKHIPKDWDMIHFGYLTEDLVIKEKINDLLNNSEKVEYLGKNAIRQIKENFSIDKMIDKFILLYKRVLVK